MGTFSSARSEGEVRSKKRKGGNGGKQELRGKMLIKKGPRFSCATKRVTGSFFFNLTKVEKGKVRWWDDWLAVKAVRRCCRKLGSSVELR